VYFNLLGLLTHRSHMKKIFWGIFILVGLLAGFGIRFDLQHKALRLVTLRLEARATEASQGATHIIFQEDLKTDRGCSATAIGPHALLTASHCELATDELTIDGRSGYTILKTLRDKNDHSIYLIPGITFPQYAKVAPRAFNPGEFVFIWGNPINDVGTQFIAMLRQGKYTASYLFKGRVVDVFDFVAISGDSGAGIFTRDGDVVGVLSFSGETALPFSKKEFLGAGAIKLNFSKEVLAKATSF
jgi:hypothetical protein